MNGSQSVSKKVDRESLAACVLFTRFCFIKNARRPWGVVRKVTKRWRQFIQKSELQESPLLRMGQIHHFISKTMMLIHFDVVLQDLNNL